jgi:hypothetical protein
MKKKKAPTATANANGGTKNNSTQKAQEPENSVVIPATVFSELVLYDPHSGHFLGFDMVEGVN